MMIDINKRQLVIFIVILCVLGTLKVYSTSNNNQQNHIYNSNNTTFVESVLNSMIDNVNLDNYSEITSVITVIEREVSKIEPLQDQPKKRNEYYQKLFKGNFEICDIYQDGGSKEFKLKDGTIIYQNYSLSSSKTELGQYRVTKPDGTIEYYTKEGKPIKK